MQVFFRAVLVLVLLAGAVSRVSADERLGHKGTAWGRPGFARAAAMEFAAGYRDFLGRNKTEREVVSAAVAMARKQGYRDLLGAGVPKLAAGSRVYAVHQHKLAAFVVMGKKPLDQGVHLVAAHTDAVRIDLKQNPVYADGNAAWLQTQYYGGIKEYQWLSTPLELRGVVVKKGGEVVPIAIGDDPGEPVLVIPDVALHVAYQVDSSEGEEVPGEALDPVLASTPAAAPAAGQDPFAAEATRLLKDMYGILPGDLAAAELALVPAGLPRDVGIDRALVGGYGQDDRVCVYAALRALLDARAPEHTAVIMLVDKEEVGSVGNTGAQSSFLRRVVAELIAGTGGTPTELAVDRVLGASVVMSADATGAVNAQYPSLYEAQNATFLGAGVVWDRSAGHAELMTYVRGLFDRAGVAHQPAMWGKSGSSTGGTVLPFFTRHGMNGLDVSIPLLSMHAPFELVSKADLYEAYRAYRAFLLD